MTDAGMKRAGRTLAVAIREAATSAIAYWRRFVFTSVSAVVGSGIIVGVVGAADSAAQRVDSRFDALAASEIILTDPDSRANLFEWTSADHLGLLTGVPAAGVVGSVDSTEFPLASPRGRESRPRERIALPVYAATPGFFVATETAVINGRSYDSGDIHREDPVALVGWRAAVELQLGPLALAPSVYVGDERFTVVGVVSDSERFPSAGGAVFVTPTAGAAALRIDPGTVYVRTAVGAAPALADVVAGSATSGRNELAVIQVPPEPLSTRAAVSDDLRRLLIAVGVMCLVVGAIGGANAMLVSVVERTPEIGLRRALGAGRGDIAVQFSLEAVASGAFGGLIGTALGVCTVAAVSIFNGWSFATNPAVLLGAWVLASVAAGVAGVYPALRAARIDPDEALRG